MHIYTTQKEVLGVEWEQEHLKEGRYTLNMVKLTDKVREVISKDIKALQKLAKAHSKNKIEGAAPQVSVAT